MKSGKFKFLIFFSLFSVSFFLLFHTASAATISRPPTNLGLVAYWSLDEGTSTVAWDMSGSQNNAVVSAGTTWVNGRRGKAVDFTTPASSPNIAAPSSSSLNFGTGSFSISMWGKYRDFTYPKAWFMIKKSNTCYVAGNPGWDIGHAYNSDGLYICYTDGTNLVQNYSLSFDTGYKPSDLTNKWAMVTIVFDKSANRVKAYVNGVKQTNEYDISTVTGSVNNSANLTIGTMYGWQSDGVVDDVRIYNRALSASEVSAMYKTGQVTRKTVSNSGLVGYWAMNEATGTVAMDSSGNGNNAAISGTTLPSWTNGKKGKGLSFDGLTSTISLSNSSSLSSLTSSFTISHWIKTTSSAGQMYTVGNAGGPDGYRFGLSSGQIAFLVGDGSYTESACGSVTVNDGSWHMITGVFSRSGTLQFTCYLDGAFVANVSLPSAYASMQANAPGIGKPPCCSAVSGLLDDVRIYNRALSAAEVANLYKQNETKINSSQNDKLTNGLVGLWSFNGTDISGTTAYDRSTNANNGTIYGATKVAGKVGQGLYFDGSSYVEAAHTASMDVTALTIAMWIKTPTSLCGGVTCYRALLSKQGADRDYNLYTYSSDGTNITHMHMSSARFGVTMPALTTAYKPGEWHHVAFTVDASGNYVHYSDGVSFASGAITAGANANSNYPIWIGRADNYYNDIIDEARVYNRALSASEIKQLYNMGR